MDVFFKPVGKHITMLTIADDINTLSNEAVFELCDKLLDNSFVQLNGELYSQKNLVDFIYSLSKLFSIDLDAVYNRYENVINKIWGEQQKQMKYFVESESLKM